VQRRNNIAQQPIGLAMCDREIAPNICDRAPKSRDGFFGSVGVRWRNAFIGQSRCCYMVYAIGGSTFKSHLLGTVQDRLRLCTADTYSMVGPLHYSRWALPCHGWGSRAHLREHASIGFLIAWRTVEKNGQLRRELRLTVPLVIFSH
jgi:hypothetical protein